ncbi:hypothetical protein ACFX2I_036811 [Malus domestica]
MLLGNKAELLTREDGKVLTLKDTCKPLLFPCYDMKSSALLPSRRVRVGEFRRRNVESLPRHISDSKRVQAVQPNLRGRKDIVLGDPLMGILEKKSMARRLMLFLLTVSAATADEDMLIGMNIRTDLSDMPHPTQVVALLKAQQIRHVRLYDVDRAMLVALANTGIKVMISVPNEQTLELANLMQLQLIEDPRM